MLGVDDPEGLVMKLVGLIFEGLYGRFAVRMVENCLVVIQRSTGHAIIHSEPCPPPGRARDEWLWRSSDRIVAVVVGRTSDPNVESGRVHDLLGQLLEDQDG